MGVWKIPIANKWRWTCIIRMRSFDADKHPCYISICLFWLQLSCGQVELVLGLQLKGKNSCIHLYSNCPQLKVMWVLNSFAWILIARRAIYTWTFWPLCGCFFPDIFRYKLSLFDGLRCWYGWAFSNSSVSLAFQTQKENDTFETTRHWVGSGNTRK